MIEAFDAINKVLKSSSKAKDTGIGVAGRYAATGFLRARIKALASFCFSIAAGSCIPTQKERILSSKDCVVLDVIKRNYI